MQNRYPAMRLTITAKIIGTETGRVYGDVVKVRSALRFIYRPRRKDSLHPDCGFAGLTIDSLALSPSSAMFV